MSLFNIVCGVCSVIGLFVSIFTARTVVKISRIFDYSNKNYYRTVNGSNHNTYYGSYIGWDINAMGDSKQK